MCVQCVCCSVCCSVLQLVAVFAAFSSVLQCAAVRVAVWIEDIVIHSP